MTWQAASFLVLGAVLLGGFAWYERSRPPSQVVALVAALAALAIAGRIAFAAFPNVKPTTDIVIFAGLALGAAPGFAVGALAALVSNFWFGQGPWTPWQMVGWGLCGVLGAVLALAYRRGLPGTRSPSQGGVIAPRSRLGFRREAPATAGSDNRHGASWARPRNAVPGRLTLAAVCGLAGIAYGALLNFSLMATYGGELSLERFLAFESRAVPFDAAHALGNVAFALLAGPAIVRMLVRFRERFEWGRGMEAASSGRPRLGGGVATVLALLVLVAVAVPPSASAADTDRAVLWLASVQNADGGWGASPDRDSSTETTAWVALGLAAAGRNPLDVARRGRTPVDFLRDNVDELDSAGDFARTILALEAAGAEPRDFGGRNLVATLRDKRAANGSWAGWPGSTAFAVMALRAAGATGGLDHSLSWLAGAQNPDDGWGDLPQPPSTADGTGAAMQAMPDTDAARRGVSYLRRHQRSSGGFVTGATGAVNSQSTAWAAQGLLAVGADAGRALDYLAARQAGDGHYRYSASSDQTPVWVTGQVLAAVAGEPFPIAAPPRKAAPSGTEGLGSQDKSAPPAAGGVAPGPAAEDLLESLRKGGGGTGGGAPAPPPAAGGIGGLPVPPAGIVPDGEAPEPAPAPPATPAAQPFTASPPAGPSPLSPLGIGLATAALAITVPWWLGRRNGW